MNSFIKDTNHFLRKIKNLGQLLQGAILFIINVVGLYPDITHEVGLASLGRSLDVRTEKKVTTETLAELAEFFLKKIIFQFNKKTLKQLRGTAAGTKSATPHANLLLSDLEGKKLEDIELQPRIWMIYFLSGNMEKIL